MSILREEERTYEFSSEGLALCKSDLYFGKRINKYKVVKLVFILGIIAVETMVMDNFMSEVAYKTDISLLSEVGYKTIEKLL